MKFLKYIILGSFLSAFSLTVFAQTCQSPITTNLTINEGSLSKLPATNQEHSELCYAYTVSLLEDAIRYSNPLTQNGRISPLVIGMQIAKTSDFSKRSRLQDGNTATKAFFALKKFQGCDHKFISAHFGSIDNQLEIFITIEMMFQTLYRISSETPCLCTPKSKNEFQQNVEGIRKFLVDNYNVQGEPMERSRFFMGDLGNIVMRLNKVPPNFFNNYNVAFDRFADTFFKRLCLGHEIRVPQNHNLVGITKTQDYSTSGFRVITEDPDRKFLKYITDSLSVPKAQPIGVNFCSKMLTGTSRFVAFSPDDSRCGSHAAVIAGQRCFKGRQQVLLRNSWGNNCGGDLAARLRPGCDGRGNLWINAEDMMKSSYSLYQIRR